MVSPRASILCHSAGPVRNIPITLFHPHTVPSWQLFPGMQKDSVLGLMMETIRLVLEVPAAVLKGRLRHPKLFLQNSLHQTASRL